MPDYSVHKASDLTPAGAEREALRRNIIAQAREIGSRGQGVSEDEADALVDEALAEIRGRRE
jgi:hypothetical protein